MISITPSTTIILCRVPFNKNYQNVIDFEYLENQENYFDQLDKISTFTDYTYNKIDNYVDVGANIDNIINANYLFYQNNDYKRYYCFIDKIEMLSENSTRIYFTTDVFQTYMFDYEIKASFIEREHVESDEVGEHTIPEALETGEYIINDSYRDNKCDNLNVVMCSTASPDSLAYFGGGIYNGLPSAVDYYNLGSIDDFSTNDVNSGKNLVKIVANSEKAEAIQSLFLAPSYLFPNDLTIYVNESVEPHKYEIDVQEYNTLDTYNPKNNKCLCYPYRYILINNGQNGSAIYQYEYWEADDNKVRKFEVNSVLCSGCSIRGIPLNYKGDYKNNLEGLNLGKFPELNWVTDPYINWLTENGLNMGTDVAMTSKIITGGVRAGAGDLVGGLATVTEAVKEQYIADLQPMQVKGNGNVGDLITSNKDNCFHIYYMSIKREYAKIIDNYFNMFGYRVNEIKVPNLKSRENWNFIKTIGINIETKIIPEEHLNILKEIYNNGVTLWHNAYDIMNYNQSNNIVGGTD